MFHLIVMGFNSDEMIHLMIRDFECDLHGIYRVTLMDVDGF